MASSETRSTQASSDGPVTAPAADATARRTVATYRDYAGAERAVDWLSDRGFAVEHVAIVGRGLRSEEQVESRMTAGRAALVGAGEGALIGMLFALLFGIFFNGPAFAELFAYSVAVGAVFGAVWGAVFHAASSEGERDFVSSSRLVADRYEVQVEEAFAAEAKRLLSVMDGAE
jgi:hypothetical protein